MRRLRLPTLDEFLTLERGNSYVLEPGFKSLYVRVGSRFLNGVRHPRVLDLAVIEARRTGKGLFTGLVARLLKQGLPIYVESVLTPRFAAKLLEMGFTRSDYDEASFFLLPPAGVQHGPLPPIAHSERTAQHGR